MPLFILVSGYLWGYKSITYSFSDFFKKKFNGYIIPYFILTFVNLLFVVIYYVLKKQFKLSKVILYVGGILYSRGTTEYMPNCSPLWFLTALFTAEIIFYFIIKQKPVVRIIIVCICFIISSVFDLLNMPKLPWNIDTALMMQVFLLIGYYFGNHKIQPQISKKYILFSIGMFITGILLIYFNPVNFVSFDDNDYGISILVVISSLFLVLAICEFLFLFHIKKVFSWLGKHTIFFMAFDYLAGFISEVLLNKMGFNSIDYLSILIFIIKIIILIIMYISYYVIIGKCKIKKIKKIFLSD